MLDFIDNYYDLDDDLEPVDYISLIEERITYKGEPAVGTIYLKNWYNEIGDNTDRIYRCSTSFFSSYTNNFDEADFAKIYNGIEKIAKHKSDFKNAEEFESFLKSEKLLDIWNIFVREFDVPSKDAQKDAEIVERICSANRVKQIGKNLAEGKKISDEEASFLAEKYNVRPTAFDWQFHNKHKAILNEQCKKRVGESVCHYHYVMRGKRVYELMLSGVSQKQIREEGRMFAMAYIMHTYGTNIIETDDTLRRRQQLISKYNFLEDDESLDKLFARRKGNATKSMLPLLVYFVLRDFTDCKYHLKQQEILIALENRYGVVVERKALGRTIHGLVNLSINVHTDKSSGTWLEQDKMQYDPYAI